jgi:hypothetical protein
MFTFPEAFLHYIWKLNLYNTRALKTIDRQSVEVLKNGQHNTDAGPDFLNARIRINGTTWAGHVELHVKSSDWQRHKHQEDYAYNSTVLHVVFEHDQTISNAAGAPIPTLELKGRIPLKYIQRYQQFDLKDRWIPCQKNLQYISTDNIRILSWTERLLIERIMEKSAVLQAFLDTVYYDWNHGLFFGLARMLGAPKNTEAFEFLVQAMPFAVLRKYQHNLFQLEALLFGQAGFLEGEKEDSYFLLLQKEYTFLAHKHNLEALNPVVWKFLRMRPVSFPTLRIALLAAIIYELKGDFMQLIRLKDTASIYKKLQVELSPYWKKHHHFGKASKHKMTKLGKQAADSLLINTLVPFMHLSGKYYGEEEIRKQGTALLTELKAEQNHLIKKWKAAGFSIKNAHDSQAFLQLNKAYCAKHKCLQCSIGNLILQQ